MTTNGRIKDRVGRLLEIIAQFNEENGDCDTCPFYDFWCDAECNKACILDDLTAIVRIVVEKDALNDDAV